MVDFNRNKMLIRMLGKVGFVVVVFLAWLTIIFALSRTHLVTVEGILADQPAPMDVFDHRYNLHPYLTFLHILPGILFFLLGPLQFVSRIRSRHLNFHRWSGRVYLASGFLAGISSMIVAVRFPAFGGISTAVATFFFAPLFLFCLARAFYLIRNREIHLHREWMIRGFAIGLGVSTIRVVVVAFEIVSDIPSAESFSAAFWLGLSINLVAAEVWVHLTRPSRFRPINRHTAPVGEKIAGGPAASRGG